jgi:glutaredoxin 3
MSSFTRRRVLVPLFALACLVLYVLLPSYSDTYYLPDWASPVGSPAARAAARHTHEIHGLLHFVVNKPDQILVPLSEFDDDTPIDPTRPIELRVYAEDGAQVDPVASARDWVARADALDRDAPLVVFSKVRPSVRPRVSTGRSPNAPSPSSDVLPVSNNQARTPPAPLTPLAHRHSRRAKELLDSYDLWPRPKIIEVDQRGTSVPRVPFPPRVTPLQPRRAPTFSRRLRPRPATVLTHPHTGDGDLIKAILARLTGRATFPNVIVRGASVGGADTLADLHARGKLAPMLRRAGIQVRAHAD